LGFHGRIPASLELIFACSVKSLHTKRLIVLIRRSPKRSKSLVIIFGQKMFRVGLNFGFLLSTRLKELESGCYKPAQGNSQDSLLHQYFHGECKPVLYCCPRLPGTLRDSELLFQVVNPSSGISVAAPKTSPEDPGLYMPLVVLLLPYVVVS
jgi:hypothetical protein